MWSLISAVKKPVSVAVAFFRILGSTWVVTVISIPSGVTALRTSVTASDRLSGVV